MTRHCCLGVLCEVAGVRSDPAYPSSETGTFTFDFDDKSSLSGYPSSKFIDMVGASETVMWELSEMNDCGKTFEEIADWIEENVDAE